MSTSGFFLIYTFYCKMLGPNSLCFEAYCIFDLLLTATIWTRRVLFHYLLLLFSSSQLRITAILSIQIWFSLIYTADAGEEEGTCVFFAVCVNISQSSFLSKV